MTIPTSISFGKAADYHKNYFFPKKVSNILFNNSLSTMFTSQIKIKQKKNNKKCY